MYITIDYHSIKALKSQTYKTQQSFSLVKTIIRIKSI